MRCRGGAPKIVAGRKVSNRHDHGDLRSDLDVLPWTVLLRLAPVLPRPGPRSVNSQLCQQLSTLIRCLLLDRWLPALTLLHFGTPTPSRRAHIQVETVGRQHGSYALPMVDRGALTGSPDIQHDARSGAEPLPLARKRLDEAFRDLPQLGAVLGGAALGHLLVRGNRDRVQVSGRLALLAAPTE